MNTQRELSNPDAVSTAPAPETEEVTPTKPVILIQVTRENLEVEMQFQRTGTNTADPLVTDVMAALAEEGVVYGIDNRRIADMCARPVYNRPVVIARGHAPEVGKDGWVEYLIPTTRELRPKIRDDGTADFKDIGFIQSARKEQSLCKIHPPLKGADGRNVYGTLLEGSYGREVNSPAGENTVFNETGTVLRAACDGHIEVKQGVINILNVLRIDGDVNNSTGNIDFTGDIIINGDVLSGFRIVTRGSILVRGSVGGASLRADGDISIGDSMNGGDRGSLRAGGNIKCRFIQNCEVYAEGDIFADTIMHCTIECGGDVDLSGKRAALIGGRTSVGGRLLAKSIGTSTHVATEVNVCATGLSKDREAAALAQNIKHLDNEVTKLVQILTRYEAIRKKAPLTEDQLQTILKVKESYIHLSHQRKAAQAQLEQVKKEQLEASTEHSYIECRDRLHTGTRLAFGPLVMQVHESSPRCRVYIKNGDISINPIT